MKSSDGIDLVIWHRLHMRNGILGPAVYEDFVAAGYSIVPISDVSKWSNIHAWCSENITPGHYSWCGSRFIFVHEEDAMKFSLTWT